MPWIYEGLTASSLISFSCREDLTMTYSIMTEADIDYIATLYMDYYNNHEDGCWTHEKAYKRIIAHGAEHIELTSVNDEHHHHFYTQFEMYAASNLKVMGKHYV